MTEVHFSYGQQDPATGRYMFTVSGGRTLQQYWQMADKSVADHTLGAPRGMFVNGAILASFTEATLADNPGASFAEALEAVLRINPFPTMYHEAPRIFSVMLNMLTEEWAHGPELREWINTVGNAFVRTL
jgi:hypothetical protein